MANEYKQQAGEDYVQDKDDIKRHWTEIMSTKFKRPTGNTGHANDFILHCHRVQLQIFKKSESSMMGGVVPPVMTLVAMQKE